MSNESMTNDVLTVAISMAVGFVVGWQWDFICEKVQYLVKMVS